MKGIFGCIVAAALLCACPPSPGPPVPDADSGQPIADAAPPPSPAADASPSDTCGAAETRLLELGCKDSRGRLLGGPNLHGVSWSDVCRDNAKNGVSLQPNCIAKAKSCAEVMSSCR